MVESLIEGLTLLLTFEAMLYLTIGMVIGIVIGFLPGLGGLATLALLIPFLFQLDPVPGLAFILGAYGAVSFGGSITAILANTPGTGEQVVTAFDGYQMAKQGKAARALGVSATASAFGGVFGVIALFVAIPFARQIITYLRPPEVFALGLLGVMTMGVMDAKTVGKGIISGGLGLMLSFIGVDPVTGVARLTFGSLDLYDGLGVTAITMGLFAISEMMTLYARGQSIAGGVTLHRSKEPGFRLRDGVMDVVRNWKLAAQGSTIGAISGIVPGIGGTFAMFFAYGWAKRRSKHPEMFGKGAPEGVLGAESANNAKEGGSLVPTVAFGIPGSSGMALMIGAFLILGYTPGPEMVTNNLEIVFLVAWILAVSNILSSAIGLGMAPLLAKATFVRHTIIAPVLIGIALIGSFIESRLFFGMALAIAAGLVGYVFKGLGFSNAGIILGFVLGPVVDRNLNIALQAYGPGFMLRPITLGIIFLALTVLFGPKLRSRLQTSLARRFALDEDEAERLKEASRD
jgi:putative tricarboxylic transport membrane protein